MRMEHKLLSSEPSALIPMHFRFPVIRETWTSNAPERFQPPSFLPPAPSLISDIINARQNTCLLWWSDSHICRGSTWETNLKFDLIRRPALSRGGEWTYVTMRARDATVTRRFIQSLDRKKPCKPYPVWLKCGGLPSCLVSIFFFLAYFPSASFYTAITPLAVDSTFSSVNFWQPSSSPMFAASNFPCRRANLPQHC